MASASIMGGATATAASPKATDISPNETVPAPKVTPNGELFYINGSQGKLAAKLSLPKLQPEKNLQRHEHTLQAYVSPKLFP